MKRPAYRDNNQKAFSKSHTNFFPRLITQNRSIPNEKIRSKVNQVNEYDCENRQTLKTFSSVINSDTSNQEIVEKDLNAIDRKRESLKSNFNKNLEKILVKDLINTNINNYVKPSLKQFDDNTSNEASFRLSKDCGNNNKIFNFKIEKESKFDFTNLEIKSSNKKIETPINKENTEKIDDITNNIEKEKLRNDMSFSFKLNNQNVINSSEKAQKTDSQTKQSSIENKKNWTKKSFYLGSDNKFEETKNLFKSNENKFYSTNSDFRKEEKPNVCNILKRVLNNNRKEAAVKNREMFSNNPQTYINLQRNTNSAKYFIENSQQRRNFGEINKNSREFIFKDQLLWKKHEELWTNISNPSFVIGDLEKYLVPPNDFDILLSIYYKNNNILTEKIELNDKINNIMVEIAKWKDSYKKSILRWHPDKLFPILDKLKLKDENKKSNLKKKCGVIVNNLNKQLASVLEFLRSLSKKN